MLDMKREKKKGGVGQIKKSERHGRRTSFYSLARTCQLTLRNSFGNEFLYSTSTLTQFSAHRIRTLSVGHPSLSFFFASSSSFLAVLHLSATCFESHQNVCPPRARHRRNKHTHTHPRGIITRCHIKSALWCNSNVSPPLIKQFVRGRNVENKRRRNHCFRASLAHPFVWTHPRTIVLITPRPQKTHRRFNSRE